MYLYLKNVDLNDIFFISDTHWGHNLMRNRRNFNTIEEMDEALIEGWNSVVKEKSIVFCLGDMSWYNPTKTLEILNRLNGTKYLVNGNHDWPLEKAECKKKFVLVADSRIELELDDDEAVMVSRDPNKKTQLIVLDHYPMVSWNKAYHGSYHLFGHVHNRIKQPLGLSMDVGVDAIGYQPISYVEVRKLMASKVNHEKNEDEQR